MILVSNLEVYRKISTYQGKLWFAEKLYRCRICRYLNDNHREKLCFTYFSTRIYWNISLATSDLFHMFSLPIWFYTFYFHILKGTDVVSKGEPSNKKKMNGYSFQQLLQQNLIWVWFGFCLNTGKRFLLEVSF